MKKILAMMLAVLMVASLFVGCNGTAGGGNQLPTNPDGSLQAPYEVDENGKFIYGDTFKGQTIEWWISSTFTLNSDMYIFKKIEEVVGCEINVTCYQGETYNAKINTAMQTNALPDIFLLGSGSVAVNNVYGDQGAFIDLLAPENLAKLPEFKKNVLDVPKLAEQVEAYKSSQGSLYTVLKHSYNRDVNYGWMYRKDIFEKHGIEMWTDSESFLNVLRQLKKAYPNSYPLTGADMYTVFDRLMNSYGANGILEAYDWDKKEWFLGASTEGFYEMLSLFQTAYNERLLDPDFFSNQVGDIDTAVLNGTSFVYNSWIGRMNVQNTQGRKQDPNFQVSFAPNIGDGMSAELPILSHGGIYLSGQSDYVDACLAIVNFLYSDEGVAASTMGEEGVTYDIVDGVKVYKNADGTPMEMVTINTLEENYGIWNEGIYLSADRNCPYFQYTPEEAEAQVIGMQGPVRPGIPLITNKNEDDADDYVDMWTNFYNELKEFCTDFVTENYSKADWQNTVNGWMDKYGVMFTMLKN